MTRAEKAGLEAYPENISYSTIGDTMYDYNAEKRRVFVEGYEEGYKESGGELLYVLNKGVKQGYKDAVEKVREFIKERFSFEDSWHVEGETSILDKVIGDFKKYVEE